MEIFTLVQRMIGGSLTTGIFIHDVYYTEKYLGLSITSVVFLMGVLFFHLLIYFKLAGIAEIAAVNDARKIERVRIIMSVFTTTFCCAECLNNIHLHNETYFTFKSIATTVLSLVIVIFPELVLKLIFLIRRNKNTN